MAVGIGGEIGWYCPSLDDAGNGTLTLSDLTTAGRDGTLTNMLTSDWNTTDTSFGGIRSLEFDGTDAHVVYPPGAYVDNSEGSFAIWFKSNDAVTEQRMLAYSQTVANIFNLMRINVPIGDLAGLIKDTVGSQVSSTAGTVTNWNSFVMTWVESFQMQLWVNGLLGSTKAIGVLLDNGNSEPTIGAGRAVVSPFNGLIDDVRFFERVLSASEIGFLASQRGFQPVPFGAATVYPIDGQATLEAYQDEVRGFTIFPVDSNGVAIDTTEMTLQVIIEHNDTGLNVEVVPDSEITKTPDSYTFVTAAATNAIVGSHLIWATRSAGPNQFVMDSGQYVIQRAAAI